MTHNSHSDIAALIQRAQRACVDIAIIGDEIVITCAESQRLLAGIALETTKAHEIAHDDAVADVCVDTPNDDDPHALAMDVLRLIRTLLTDFPLEWQVHIVKALTARTMLLVAEQTRKLPLTPAA